jgi:hypothetical protein
MVQPITGHRKAAPEIHDVKPSLQPVNMETGMPMIGKRSGSLFEVVAVVARLAKNPLRRHLNRLGSRHLSVIFC